MSDSDPSALSARKSDHIDLALGADVGFRKTTLLEEVELVHSALPEVDFASLDTSVQVFGKILRAPLLIAAMTGGNARARDLNEKLGAVAEGCGIAIGLGSQRAMVKKGEIDEELRETYAIRKAAPTALLFGNIGVVQAKSMSLALVEEMLGTVDADALCIHLNPAQEIIQADGDRDFRGGLETIARLRESLSLPIIVKETGCGISREVAQTLRSLGVANVDVSGAGGTSWVAVETHRATEAQKELGELFWNWGLPTAASLLEVAPLGFETVIATGGLKNGLDVARAIVLGATLGGIARPVLKALDGGGIEGASAYLEKVRHQLKTTMLLTGARDLRALGKVRRRLGPELAKYATPAPLA